MKLTRPHIIASVLGLILLVGLISPVVPHPTFEAYTGIQSFSGEVAYQELERFVDLYPYRYAGSDACLAAADYVATRMRDIGLTVEFQDFDTYSALQVDVQNEQRGSPFNPGRNVKSIFRPLTGRNVIGFLPGRSSETIIIGAHRDVISTIQGAEDNGTGTVAMLQIAEILAAIEREYSSVFVSYDAEEIAIMGSERFIAKYADLDIILALSLDMLGWKEADRVGFYPFVAAGRRTDLWVYSLAMQLADLKPHYSPSIWQDMLKTSWQMIPTDTHPFARRGIPVLGIVAVNDKFPGYTDNRPIHTPNDTMSIVSADTILMTGQFVEQFLLTLESGAIDRGFTSLYVPRADGIIPPWYVGMSYALLIFGLVFILAFDIYSHYVPLTRADFIRELPWLARIAGLACGTTLFWFNLFSSLLSSLHLAVVLFIGFGLPGLGLLTFAYWRNKAGISTANSSMVYSLGLLVLLLVG
ncbi:MAG: M28 family peptidase, partial [Bacillota bacterium]|nr:M28 family peptidase [Bacillota bacterium]